MHTNSDWTILVGVFEFEILNGLEDLAHEFHDLDWRATVGENIEQVRAGGEVETWEAFLLLVHESVEGLLTNLKFFEYLVEALQNPVLVAEHSGVLLGAGVSKDALHLLIDEDEVLGLFWEFLLHFIGVEEQVLQVGPIPLHISGHSENVGDVTKGLGPVLDLTLEGGDVTRGLHGGGSVGVLLKQVEVLVCKTDQHHVGVLVLVEVELDVFPDLLELGKGLLHLGLLLGLIGDLLNVFFVVLQVQVVNILEHELVIDVEVLADLLADGVPMAVTHGWVSQLSNKWQEDEPLLDFIKDTAVSVGTLVNFHVLEGLEELLHLVFHLVGLSLNPLGLKVALEDLLASADVVPKTLHVAKLNLDRVDVLVAAINKVGVVELLGSVAEVTGLLLVSSHLGVDGLEAGECVLTTAIVLVEVTLLHFLNELLELLLKLSNRNVVLLGLSGNNWGDLLLDVLGELLEGVPVIEELPGLLDLGVLNRALGSEEVKGLLELVQL